MSAHTCILPQRDINATAAMAAAAEAGTASVGGPRVDRARGYRLGLRPPPPTPSPENCRHRLESFRQLDFGLYSPSMFVSPGEYSGDEPSPESFVAIDSDSSDALIAHGSAAISNRPYASNLSSRRTSFELPLDTIGAASTAAATATATSTMPDKRKTLLANRGHAPVSPTRNFSEPLNTRRHARMPLPTATSNQQVLIHSTRRNASSISSLSSATTAASTSPFPVLSPPFEPMAPMLHSKPATASLPRPKPLVLAAPATRSRAPSRSSNLSSPPLSPASTRNGSCSHASSYGYASSHASYTSLSPAASRSSPASRSSLVTIRGAPAATAATTSASPPSSSTPLSMPSSPTTTLTAISAVSPPPVVSAFEKIDFDPETRVCSRFSDYGSDDGEGGGGILRGRDGSWGAAVGAVGAGDWGARLRSFSLTVPLKGGSGSSSPGGNGKQYPEYQYQYSAAVAFAEAKAKGKARESGKGTSKGKGKKDGMSGKRRGRGGRGDERGVEKEAGELKRRVRSVFGCMFCA